MKTCPLRVHALESVPGNVQTVGNASELAKAGAMGDAGKELLLETIGCLEKHCAWWDGDACAVLAVTELMAQLGNDLERLNSTIRHKE